MDLDEYLRLQRARLRTFELAMLKLQNAKQLALKADITVWEEQFALFLSKEGFDGNSK